MTQLRNSKRSRRVVLTTLTAAVGTVALQGCGGGNDSSAEGQVFGSVAECAASGALTQAECQDAYTQAQADDANNAPRFESRTLCEQEFGNGDCQPRNDNNGSFWVPLLAGFVVGNIAGEVIDEVGDASRRRRYGGLYRNRSSGIWYHGGSNYGPLARGSGGRYNFNSAGFTRPVSAPRTHSSSSVTSRGGFGGRSGSGA